MDRPICYPQELIRTADFLGLAKDTLYGIGNLAQATVGATTAVSGLGISATGPATLQIVIGAGSIYTQEAVDATAYGSLGTDLNNVVKQGIIATPTTLTITPPTTSGYSQVFLVEVAYQDIDGGATVLPFYNSSNPLVPYSGPNNLGASQNTVRFGSCIVALKAGVAAPTGSQTTPSADSGYVALYAITVANGQATITSANWTTVPGAPLIPYNLVTLPYRSAVASGVNALAISVPSVSALTVGMQFMVKNSGSGVTGPATLNVNMLGNITLAYSDGSALANGDYPTNATALVEYDGTQFNLLSVVGPSVFARSSKGSTTQIYNTAGTFTFTAPVAGWYWVEVYGAGGGAAPFLGGTETEGGGGGGSAEGAVHLTAGQAVTVTVGAAGVTNGTIGGVAGSGGTSSFGAYMSATGGTGANIGTVGNPGAGGVGSGGQINLTGQGGGDGYGSASTGGMLAGIGGNASGPHGGKGANGSPANSNYNAASQWPGGGGFVLCASGAMVFGVSGAAGGVFITY